MKIRFLNSVSIVAICSLFIFAACGDDAAPEKNDQQNNNTGGGGFTPPTTDYWKINGIATPGSADAFSVVLDASNAGLSKPFPGPIDGYCQISFDFQSGKNVRQLIEEGKSVAFPISTRRSLGTFGNGDSVAVNISMHDQSDPDAGYYYFVAQGGKLYISNIGGKLRYTTDGVIQMTGVKNPDINLFNYSATLDFSWLER